MLSGIDIGVMQVLADRFWSKLCRRPGQFGIGTNRLQALPRGVASENGE